MIQADSGERSFTISTESVENLPIANRSFTALAIAGARRQRDGADASGSAAAATPTS